MRVVEALNQSLHRLMSESDAVYFLGEDVLDPYGGAFKVARGLSTAFPERVLTTPVSEAGITGVGIGLALRGLRPVVEIMFGDFLALAADQIVNHAAKLRWMSEDRVRVPLVIRTPMGGRRGYGPTHSQTLEKHFLGVPGLQVVALSDLDQPGDLLRTAVLQDDDPVLFIEHKLLYAAQVQPLETLEEFEVLRIEGRYPQYRLRVAAAPPPSVTLAAYGHMASLARQAALRLAYEKEIFTEILVPTLLSPFRAESVLESVAQTGGLLTLEEGSTTLGWGAEIVSQAAASVGPGTPLRRLGARDLPIPAAITLEEAVLPGVEAIIEAVECMQGLR